MGHHDSFPGAGTGLHHPQTLLQALAQEGYHGLSGRLCVDLLLGAYCLTICLTIIITTQPNKPANVIKTLKVLMVVTSTIGLMLAKHGVGTAIMAGEEVAVEPEVMHALLFWTSNLLLFGINAIAFSKVSWFITLIRLVVNRRQKVALWMLMVFSTTLLLVASTFGYYQCHFLPYGSWSYPETSDHRCLDNGVAIKISLVTSIYSTVLVREVIWPLDTRAAMLFRANREHVRNLRWRLFPPMSFGTCHSNRAPRLASSVPRAWPLCK